MAGAVSGLKSARELVLFRCSVVMLCNAAVPGSPSPYQCREVFRGKLKEIYHEESVSPTLKQTNKKHSSNNNKTDSLRFIKEKRKKGTFHFLVFAGLILLFCL